jgi:hypothetical protein
MWNITNISFWMYVARKTLQWSDWYLTRSDHYQEHCSCFPPKGKAEWKFTRFFHHHPTKRGERNSLACIVWRIHTRLGVLVGYVCTTKMPHHPYNSPKWVILESRTYPESRMGALASVLVWGNREILLYNCTSWSIKSRDRGGPVLWITKATLTCDFISPIYA